ncbi:efflux RND transporter periplasmic adaptor subunit [Flavisolibacter tropicus]|uniref:Uncharacterized protein n=1 Tax=Flavisolibacter tropicus TaxID=1492898 RepID=A0A172TRI8_9BACT|nr:efflux RND transporter periplasmic adaptor subunit [Flavisolibacter tropicus]ANE49681.1 hypothetical protein SY85_03370 [Flavisolibacter tropicus]
MKKHRLVVWMVLSLAVVTLSGITLFKKNENNTILLTTKPSFGSISKTVTATGTLQPVDTVAVGAQVSGTIKNIYVDFNSVVRKGQLLADLDPVLLLSQERQIAANHQQAKSNLEYQSANYYRQLELFNAGAISKADMETATYQYQAAGDNLNSNAAQLSEAQKNLSFTHIYSPIDGTVLSRNISVGQTVASSFNTPTLFSIANDLTQMQVRASVDEADIGSVQKGEKASFTVDAYPDETFYGMVQEIRLEPAVTANVVTYTTIIEVNNASRKLKPGMTANINIITQEQDHVLLVPLLATQFTPDPSQLKKYRIVPLVIHTTQQKATFNNSHIKSSKNSESGNNAADIWIEKGDTLLEKQIQTGLSNDVQQAVINGLNTGDVVVTGIRLNKGNNKANKEERSPFMPTRGGRTGR